MDIRRKQPMGVELVKRGIVKESDIEKYLPWSKDLPQDMKNYDGEYKELNIEE